MSKFQQSPPDESWLREAAIAHLARYPSTQVGLARVLERRIDKWAIRARRNEDSDVVAAQVATARALIPPIVAKLAGIGAVNDDAFAKGRSRSLTRAGTSPRAVRASLTAKGVPPDIAREAAPLDPEREYGACLAAARKRRIGPFGAEVSPEARNKQRATLARGGFSDRTIRDIFKLTRDEAEEQLNAWRSEELE
jgi:regulatory protein